MNPDNRKRTEKNDENSERRFVLISKSDTYDPNEESEVEARKRDAKVPRPVKTGPRRDDRRETTRQDPTRRDEKKDYGLGLKPEPPRQDGRRASERPGVDRRRSRQDLPTLETKVPREIPPQFRRSNSAFSTVPKEQTETPKVAATPRTPGEYFLSPEANRLNNFSQSVPKQNAQQNVYDALWGKTGTPVERPDKRNSGSRPGTPSSEKRNSGNFENGGRPVPEKMTRPQQLAEELSGRRLERQTLSAKSSRSSTHSTHYSSSDEDDIAPDSDTEYHRRRHMPKREDRHLRSPSRSNRSSLDAKQASRFSSPLPSPKLSPSQIPSGKDTFDRADKFPPSAKDRRPSSRPVSPYSPDTDASRADRLNPTDNAPQRPKSRQSNTVSTPQANRPAVPQHGALSSHSMPIPIPSNLHTHTEAMRSPVTPIPHYDDNRPLGPRPQPQAQGQPTWQPPSFQPPPENNLDKPVGSFRRYSEDLERGRIAPLPTCPRTISTPGHNDWLYLPGCSSSFAICPSCFSSIIAPTKFAGMFVQDPPRRQEKATVCDFGSSPWYRIAWLLTLKEKRRDLQRFYGLAEVAAISQPCLGANPAVQPWYSIIDPRTRAPIQGFDVCTRCVLSIEVLLPSIQGIFVSSHDSKDQKRICDLRFDSKRFIRYFDQLEVTADRATWHDTEPYTRELVRLCRDFAATPECSGYKDFRDRKWHIITQLPEFTVCPECFDEIVYPEIEDGKSVAKLFCKETKRIPRASCQLYSERMRGIFRHAVNRGDYLLLASKARERRVEEEIYKDRLKLALYTVEPQKPRARQLIVQAEEDWKRFE